MRIIIDGCDGTGKTTLASIIKQELPDEREILHFSYPKTDNAFTEFKPAYEWNDFAIFDRSWLDEMIYSQLKWRPKFTDEEVKFFQEATKNDIYIICVTDLENIKKAFAERGEDYINDEEANIVNEFFKNQAITILNPENVIFYDLYSDWQDIWTFLQKFIEQMFNIAKKNISEKNQPQGIIEDDVEIEKVIEDIAEVAEDEEGTKEVETAVDTSKNVYNTTDLDPVKTFERHVFHRDQFAHYLRWSFVLKYLRDVRDEQVVCDFGCGKWNLYEVLYRNRYTPKNYFGLDIRKQTIDKNRERFPKANWIAEDLVTLEKNTNLDEIQADVVTSFEVIEHVGKRNVDTFLQNFKKCWNDSATYYLSTPNYSESVGAADNHTYPDYEWGPSVPQEFSHEELQEAILRNWFEIVKKVWTFASIKDYKDFLETDPVKKQMFDILRENLDSNVLSVVMAVLVPGELARNCLWVLTKNK